MLKVKISSDMTRLKLDNMQYKIVSLERIADGAGLGTYECRVQRYDHKKRILYDACVKLYRNQGRWYIDEPIFKPVASE